MWHIVCLCAHIGEAIFQKKDNREYLSSNKYLAYKWFLGIVFRLGPTILLAYLNLRIIIAYRRTCAKRRTMTGSLFRRKSLMQDEYKTIITEFCVFPQYNFPF